MQTPPPVALASPRLLPQRNATPSPPSGSALGRRDRDSSVAPGLKLWEAGRGGEESADWAVQRGGPLIGSPSAWLLRCEPLGFKRRHLPSSSPRCKSSSLHLTAIVLKLPGRALLGKAQVGGASCPVHAHSSGRSLPPWGSPFWELRAARGVGGSGVRSCKETVPAAREPGPGPSESAAVRCPAPCSCWAS